MDVTIDTRGFTLDTQSRELVATRAHGLAGLTWLAVTIEWRVAPIFSEAHDQFHASARATFESETVTCAATSANQDELIEALFAQLETAVARRRWLAEGAAAPCAWCGGGTFALIESQRLGELGPICDTLVCAQCGHVEQFARNVRAVMALEGTVVVHARAKPPYR